MDGVITPTIYVDEITYPWHRLPVGEAYLCQQKLSQYV